MITTSEALLLAAAEADAAIDGHVEFRSMLYDCSVDEVVASRFPNLDVEHAFAKILAGYGINGNSEDLSPAGYEMVGFMVDEFYEHIRRAIWNVGEPTHRASSWGY